MTVLSAGADAPRRSFQEVWVVSIGHALTHWYPATFYLLLPLIGAELGLSYSQIGAILTCQFAAGAIANVPGGIFVDTVGRKGLLMAVSLFWIGFPYLVMGFSHAYWMMLACVDAGRHRQQPLASDRDPVARRPLSRAQGPGDVVSQHGRQCRRCARAARRRRRC